MAGNSGPGEQQNSGFLYLYALAISGAAVAYIPFLTVILPAQVAMLAGGDALSTLAYITFAGAITASVSNILFGRLSDQHYQRRRWIAGGMAASSAMLLMIPLAKSGAMLIAMVVGWQICLNMMLAPLAAWAGDTVPDSQKGRLGGMLALAPAVGGIAAVLATWRSAAASEYGHWMAAILVIIMVGPLVIFGRPAAMPQLTCDPANAATPPAMPSDQIVPQSRTAVQYMWLARLLVQISEAALFAFLLLWFRSQDAHFSDRDIAVIFAVAATASVGIALAVGRWSDRTGRAIFPLALCAALAAAGLLIMAIQAGAMAAIAGYLIFGVATRVFLALHSAQTLRVLTDPRNRGRDLGLFNLTNTIPSMIMPWLIVALVPQFGFAALLWLLAGLSLAACLLLAAMPQR